MWKFFALVSCARRKSPCQSETNTIFVKIGSCKVVVTIHGEHIEVVVVTSGDAVAKARSLQASAAHGIVLYIVDPSNAKQRRLT